MKITDTVSTKTTAGVWLADVPVDGTYNQKRKQVCVFKGVGTIIGCKETIIDYSAWDDSAFYDITHKKTGIVKYQNFLVKCDNGEGWTGAGALVKNPVDIR